MLEGLEAVEIMFSNLNDVIDYRIESEFFEKRFLKLETLINKTKTIPFKKIATFTNGRPYNSESFNNINGIRIAKIGDVTNKRDFSLWEYVEKEEFKRQNGEFLKDGDILMTLTGDPPDVGKVLYIHNPPKATWNQRVARIELLDEKKILSNETLYVILSTEYSRRQLERFAKGIRQRNLGNESLERLKIPVFSNKLQDKLKKIIIKRFFLLEQSKQSYTLAEEILMEELGLKDFKPSNEPVNIKSNRESFLATGRLDPEYYQKKYEDYLEKIYTYKNKYDKLKKVCKIKDENFYPQIDKVYKYIELADIGKTGNITSCTVEKGKNLPTRARRKVRTNDVIISSIEGSLDSCALITDEYNNAVCSTGFYVINSVVINSETLLILFKSELMQNILKKGCSGTILTAINKTELENIPIPLIDNAIQQQIAELVEKSFALKKQSEKLLETAKRAVEIAIEVSEEKAIEYINTQNLS